MNEPSYKPNEWVVYQKDEDFGGFGQIVGGSYSTEGWYYVLSGPLLDTTFVSVHQDEIIRLFENGSWLEPRHNGAGSSAYAADQAQG